MLRLIKKLLLRRQHNQLDPQVKTRKYARISLEAKRKDIKSFIDNIPVYKPSSPHIIASLDRTDLSLRNAVTCSDIRLNGSYFVDTRGARIPDNLLFFLLRSTFSISQRAATRYMEAETKSGVYQSIYSYYERGMGKLHADEMQALRSLFHIPDNILLE